MVLENYRFFLSRQVCSVFIRDIVLLHINTSVSLLIGCFEICLMDIFERNQFRFRSLPLPFVSKVRSWSLERRSSRYYLQNSPSLTQRRNGISADSYNEVRKRILNRRCPTRILQETAKKEILIADLDLPFAASSYFILTFVNQCSTLILFNESEELYRLDLSAELVYLYDLCWSSKLNRFLLAGYSLYTFDPRSYHLDTLESICSTRGEWIVSITCNDRCVYLLYSSRSTRLECRSLFLLNHLEKQWPDKVFLRRKDFLAQSIRINSWNVLAILIRERSGAWRVDLFHSINLQRIFSGSNLGQGIPGMRCSFLISYQRMWIVVNNCFQGEHVILLDETSQIKAKTNIAKSSKSFNLCLMGNEWILVNLKDRLRFYPLE